MQQKTSDVKAIFCEALGNASPAAVTAYLDEACGGDRELRSRVEALLQADQAAGNFLGSPTPDDTATNMEMREDEEGPGSQIGPYRLVDELGHGTFGTVYRAQERGALCRTVAVKIVKPGMDSKEFIARFETERQTLAIMDHPNIARVFGAGATRWGRPYFAMELVHGYSLTEYCDRKNLTTEERLGLFVSVCQAVQHAHQKGIIHRDLKPSNILVAEIDDKPIAKVIDFGIAKALHQPLTDHTLATRRGQKLGTPLYMSPEQADPNSTDVDTRSDIYSLGVVLYELLTGSTPVDRKRLQNAGPSELTRIICEEEPPRPSTRINTLGAATTQVCKHRRAEPRKLAALMRGDLDWIVMKCLEKDRSRRYETANGLAKDLQRYLNHQPVEASPPSAWYAFRKFCRRNRQAIQTAVAAALLLIIAMAGVLKLREVHAERAIEIARQQAYKNRDEAERLLNQGDVLGAFELLQEVEIHLPLDPKTAELLEYASSTWTLDPSLSGTAVSVAPLEMGPLQWNEISGFPCRLPRVEHFFRIEKSGHTTAHGCAGPDDVHLRAALTASGDSPANMVYLESTTNSGRTFAFLIDRYEVTNSEYQSFIDQGGYQRQEFWRHLTPYLLNEKEVSWQQLLDVFRDKNGEFGPSTWENGRYPDGEGAYPVRGVSWYEAAAYAEFAGKRLPTVHDWERAACFEQADQLVARSNFGGRAPWSTANLNGMNFFGVCNMAGNAKEWCWNATPDNLCRAMRGGAWDEHSYMFRNLEAYPPSYRESTFGFRCVKYLEALPDEDSGSITGGVSPLAPLATAPTSEELGRIRSFFQVDRDAPLHEKPIGVKETASYRHETIEIDAAYGKDRFAIHLLLPTGSLESGKPMQPIVFFPGTGTRRTKQFGAGGSDFAIPLALAQTGRAVCYPIYQGTFERSGAYAMANTRQRYRELEIQQVQDLIRAVDYLHTRTDMATDQLTYVGWSWGGNIATRMVVLEDRFKACVIMGGGLQSSPVRELDGRIYAPFVTVPVLMVGGKFDTVVSFPARQVPLLRALEACSDKTLETFDSGHFPPLDGAITKIDEWLNERFEPGAAPPRTEWLQHSADIMMHQKRFSEAEEKYAEVVSMLSEEKGPEHRDTLVNRRRLGMAICAQERLAEGMTVLEECLKSQLAAFGKEDEDTRATALELAGVYGGSAGRLAGLQGRSDEEYRRAVAFARRGIEISELVPLESKGYRRVWLALAQYRLAEWSQCLSAIQESLAKDHPHYRKFLILAMCQWKLGHEQSARDWYTVACECIEKYSFGADTLRSEAAALLGLPIEWPPKDWKPMDSAAVYTRLIAEQPDLGWLYRCRAAHWGRLGEWERAAEDAEAALARPDSDWRDAEALASFVLYARPDDADKVLDGIWKRHAQDRNPNARMDLVVMSSLSRSANLDRNQLNEVADGVLEELESRAFLELGKGMALYRLGRFEEALERLPQSELGGPKNEIVAILFRAMAHYQLRDYYTSARLLEQARQQVTKQLPSPDGPMLRHQDTPVIWCMIHTAFREAESLMKRPRDASEVPRL
jgi:serine/threonine protein kinase/pimeloyl-ACP methyl ester carboxylesterase/tetratricopeptide (TPR) repeat protein